MEFEFEIIVPIKGLKKLYILFQELSNSKFYLNKVTAKLCSQNINV